MIISVTNLKGGVGKTTTAMYLAACIHEDGHKVVVIDADAEQSALNWAQTSDELNFQVLEAKKDGLARQATELAKEHIVIIDSPPNNRETLRSAGNIAHFILVPIAPTGLDLNRLRSTLEILLDIEVSNPAMDTRLLFTRWDGRKLIAREAIEVLDGFPIAQAKIRSLTRYEQSFGLMPSYLSEYDEVWEVIKEVKHVN